MNYWYELDANMKIGNYRKFRNVYFKIEYILNLRITQLN